ncbi:bifunctional riboflavin kinase/FAD synthetase [Alkalihalobacillus hwajinpoensis]|uniref:bifunctional riboflavin kinase/FAD synthetase n=1 Tax=Guptibacillus hwajinpoensis TaxID=208199 RepID=UPI001884332F|nr:bifunctional riboflavin kinase/FAD synthetase [Pseudalkalibacillus hwajinpoensis]MBF0708459.1 bifunctional riboflavin kinase/FAD synthetase [Pseudalkalibacillus hwajinpoensis]
MKTIYLSHPHQLKSEHPAVMALGYFDGIHRGHQKVISTAKEIAEDKGVESAVMTFYPHPSVVLGKSTPQTEAITPLDDKIELIEQLGIDVLYVVKFDTTIAGLTPQQFVDDYIIALSVVHVVAGFDFTYGSKGRGTMDSLPFHARNQFSQTVIDKVSQHDEKVSSTLIRSYIREGAVQNVKAVLGRNYTVKGTVVQGDQRGRTIGFPTANIDLKDEYLVPATGVYAVRMKTEGSWMSGVCNVGYKPTFYDEKPDQPSLEVHIFDYSGNLYGSSVEVEFHQKIRGEVKFSSVDDLIAQIGQDAKDAREILK